MHKIIDIDEDSMKKYIYSFLFLLSKKTTKSRTGKVINNILIRKVCSNRMPPFSIKNSHKTKLYHIYYPCFYITFFLIIRFLKKKV